MKDITSKAAIKATHHTAMTVTVEHKAGMRWQATCDAMPGWTHDISTTSETIALWIGSAAAHEEKARQLRAMADPSGSWR